MSASDVKSIGRSLRQIEDPATRRILESILSNISALKSSVEVLENPADLEWFDLELQNGWVQYGDTFNKPQYSIDSFGVARLRGLIKSGTATAGTILFNIPKNVRPVRKELIDVQSNGALGRIDILPKGDVIINTGSNAWLSLDNVSFSVAR